MKVRVIISSCVMMMCLAFFSCSQDDIVYSCDKEVNAWVKENLADIQQMSRSEWIKIGNIDSQRAVYRVFTPESMTPDRRIDTIISSTPRLRNGTERNCDCNGSMFPPESSGDYFACVRGIYQCNTSLGCAVTSWGCGQLWLYKCNGICM